MMLAITGPKQEATWALPYITDLARAILSKAEYQEAETVAVNLVRRRKEFRSSIDVLCELVAPPPKRPLYYVQEEVLKLPRYTRNAIKYLGDYIDHLVKYWVAEKSNDNRNFGVNLQHPIYSILSFHCCSPFDKT